MTRIYLFPQIPSRISLFYVTTCMFLFTSRLSLRNVLNGVNPVEEDQVSDVEYDTDEEIWQEESGKKK